MKRGLVRRSPTAGVRGVGLSEVLVGQRIVPGPKYSDSSRKSKLPWGLSLHSYQCRLCESIHKRSSAHTERPVAFVGF